MPKCPKCGTDVSDKSIEYCPECGARVRKVETIKKVIVEKESKEKENVKSITAGLIVSWIVGAYFIFSGLTGLLFGLGDSQAYFIPKYLLRIFDIIEICMGALILPITNNYLETKFKIKLSRGLKILIVIAYFIVSIILVVHYLPKP